jgi:drug/metabolite transporter (DMT)-like permease
LLQYTHPTFTAILALLFLKERVSIATIACIALSFTGLVIFTAPNWLTTQSIELPWLSLMAALIGAFGSACAYVVVRKLSRTEDASVIIFYFPMFAFPVSTFLLILTDGFVMPDGKQLILLLAIGIFVQIGQLALTHAMASDNAGKVSAYGYVQILFAAILGFAFFAEVPTVWTLAGGLFIVSGALINTGWMPKRLLSR